MSWFQLFLRQDSRPYAQGDVIFAAGDAAKCMYVVAEGEVDVVIGGQLMETLGPAGVFGEMALITHEPRSATARARTACRLVEIPEGRFMYLVQETPNFALEVMRVLTARLRRHDPQ
jgi:CRP/FNR family transcriptional regulator, cyclic AMP receptor protein